ncbi:MAG: xanthine dehydrogenase family protein molybdopterin-binding subunit, partial [Gammaproteobacteria bacterium]
DKTGRSLDYGRIAALGRIPESLPEVDPSELKDPSEFRLIGSDMQPLGLSAKVNGTTQYSIDISLPDLAYASVSRPPVMGATVKAVDDAAARSMPGVIGIYRRDHEVAVAARSYFEAMNARSQLRIEWDIAGGAGQYDSEQAIEQSSRIARDLNKPGIPWDSQGAITERFEAAGKIFDREYRSDFMYHASMEPLNAVVWVKDGGRSAEVWAGTQAPAYTVDTVARATGIEPSNVTLHRSLLGGAFGRRSVYGMDFVDDAAWLSKELDRPVKVIWSREDDIRNGYFRPMTAQYLRAALDGDGRILAWHHRVACEDPIRRYEPLLHEAWNHIPLIGMHGSEHQGMDGSPLPYAYDLPDRLVEYLAVEAGVRVYAMRGVGSMPNKFAIESFIDELADEFRIDPMKFRLKLLHRSERAQQVLQAVAEMASWGKPRPGRALGLAYGHHADSLLACVVEASVDAARENIIVHNVWVAADVGIVVQPDNVRAQVEGGVVFGLSNALMERITVKNGQVQQSNFHDYPIMRMHQVPVISVKVIASRIRPTGVGETGTVVTPAALANAFAALTGRRIRHLPMTRERIVAALG